MPTASAGGAAARPPRAPPPLRNRVPPRGRRGVPPGPPRGPPTGVGKGGPADATGGDPGPAGGDLGGGLGPAEPVVEALRVAGELQPVQRRPARFGRPPARAPEERQIPRAQRLLDA